MNILYSGILLSLFCACNAEISTILPTIRPLYWTPDYATTLDSNYTIFSNHSLLILKRNFSGTVVLECEAPYPVTWTRETAEHLWVNNVRAERHVANFSDTSTYTYSMKLLLSPAGFSSLRVGKFVCEEIQVASNTSFSEARTARLVIVIEAPSRFTWNNEKMPSVSPNIDHHIQDIYYNLNSISEEILVPCFAVNIFESDVSLHKRINETLFSLGEKEIVRFEPFTGYFLNKSLILTSEFGEYICHRQSDGGTPPNLTKQVLTSTEEEYEIEEYEDEDAEMPTQIKNVKTFNNSFIIFRIQKMPNNNSNRIAQFSLEIDNSGNFWKKNNKLYCCSNPYITRDITFVNTACEQPLLCLTRRRLAAAVTTVRDLGTSPNNRSCIVAGVGDLFSEPNWTPQHLTCLKNGPPKEVSSSTVTVGDPQTSFFIEEVGRRTNHYYDRYNSVFYVGDSLHLVCSANGFYFANGIFWELHFENHTAERFLGHRRNYSPISNFHQIGAYLELRLTVDHQGLIRIDCIVPLWNSSEWIFKSWKAGGHKLNIRVPVAPYNQDSILGNLVHNLTFYTGQLLELNCSFEGIPTPDFNWTLPNTTDFSYPHDDISRVKMQHLNLRGKKVISLGSSKYPHGSTLPHSNFEGTFLCFASNFGGNGTMTFHVTGIGSFTPTIFGEQKEVVVFYVGDRNQRINCNENTAVPPVKFRWKKFNHEITNNSYYNIENSEHNSYIVYEVIKPQHEGEYTCFVSNFRGAAEKVFIVRVRDPIVTHSKINLEIYLLTFLILLVFCVVVLIFIHRSNAKKLNAIRQVTVHYNRALDPAQSLATISPLFENQ